MCICAISSYFQRGLKNSIYDTKTTCCPKRGSQIFFSTIDDLVSAFSSANHQNIKLNI
jgi:hypothetical protein